MHARDEGRDVARGETGASLTVAGEVTLIPVSGGSHSERMAPALLGRDGRYYRLHLLGENAFEQPTLTGLNGQRVRVSGTWHNNVVRVSLEGLVIDDP